VRRRTIVGLEAAPPYRFAGMMSRFNALAGNVDLARDLVAATRGADLKILAGNAD
jgi:hypothetical protein